jgi:hypothetical protein
MPGPGGGGPGGFNMMDRMNRMKSMFQGGGPPGMSGGAAVPGVTGTKPDPKAQKKTPMRFEFFIIFVWKEPTQFTSTRRKEIQQRGVCQPTGELMKVEKEVLIKQHFWILLAVLIPLVLICLIVHWTATANAIEGKKKDFEKSEKDLQGIKKPKNEKWLADLKIREDEVAQQKKDLMTWPDQERLMQNVDPADRQKFENLYFGDPIPAKICEKYSNPNGPYIDQFSPVINIVNPVNEKGEGMVQFKGSWEAIIPSFDWNKKEIHRPVASEELWILQEDLAVYRELLTIIRDTNELIATFHKNKDAVKLDKSKGEIDHQIFTNPTWRLDLVVAEERNKKLFRCQMTNISQRRQPLGIYFLIKIKGMKAWKKWCSGSTGGRPQSSALTSWRWGIIPNELPGAA